MKDRAALLREMYEAFNARDVERVLSVLHPDVDWANGWQGGRVIGRDAVKSYWAEQWDVIDPKVTPISIEIEGNGALVDVHQAVRNKRGSLLAEHQVRHEFLFEGDLVRRMDIK